ncbi:hypothetical protein [Pseudomonas sp. TWP3-1]|uniref:hypothetical protein n=1 Tax=Pseudomonas sp. TWP3-1 TaxID=2804631 RepID=UPI003CE899C0
MTTALPAPVIKIPTANSKVKNPVNFKGNGAPGATVSLKVDGVSHTIVVPANGSWHISIQLGEGSKIAAAYQVLDGETSLPTPELKFEVE